MPGGASNAFCPERFAALIARFETANPSEAEAMNAARAMRRMVAMNNLRLVDVLERMDVKNALDVQLQPVREENPEMKAALEQAVALREELTERTSNVRELAELLKQQQDTTEGLRKELQAVTRQKAQRQTRYASAPSPAASFVSNARQQGCGFIQFALLVVVLILIVFGTLHLTMTALGF
jgi:hypothetical protein